MVKSIEEGGLNALDFSVMNGVLKLKWLNSFILHKDSFWFSIPDAIFQKMGGIEFLVRCDYDICKLPVKTSDCHQQVLLYWNLLSKHFIYYISTYKHYKHFTPNNSPLWNNRYILTNRKSLFLRT